MKPALYAFAALAVVATLYACGGGGGGASSGSGRPPVASEPGCSGVVPAPGAAAQVGGANAGYRVPVTSIPNPADAGIRAHTNHILLASSIGRAVGPSGMTPTQVRGAYGVAGSGSGAIAIVDANNYPTALGDFNVFSSTFSLPVETSADATAGANTVFQVVYAAGSQPTDDSSWSQEAAIDVQWAHAMAPSAKIYLVEAASSSLADLMAAVDVAKALPGVKQVSMSWGTLETPCEFVQEGPKFLFGGVTFFAAAGDTAAERDFPAESYQVIAVGGTTLSATSGGVWLTEVVWNSTGGGPSHYEPRPIYQDTHYSKIGRYRGACDIAADGDPNTGVSVYDSFPDQGSSGWLVFGGTSVATPLVAGCVNAAGNLSSSSQALNARLYGGIGGANLHDIVAGSAGSISASAGWDFPSGVGSPNNLGPLLGG